MWVQIKHYYGGLFHYIGIFIVSQFRVEQHICNLFYCGVTWRVIQLRETCGTNLHFESIIFVYCRIYCIYCPILRIYIPFNIPCLNETELLNSKTVRKHFLNTNLSNTEKLVWSCLSLPFVLLWSSSNKETGLMTSLRKLMMLQIPVRDKQTKISYYRSLCKLL